jgi:hypothetical protein
MAEHRKYLDTPMLRKDYRIIIDVIILDLDEEKNQDEEF